MNHEIPLLELISSNDFVAKCQAFATSYERLAGLNNLQAGRINELEQENERLKSQTNPAADEFIRLMGPQMQQYESFKGILAEKPAELLRAYVMAGGKKYLEGEQI